MSAIAASQAEAHALQEEAKRLKLKIGETEAELSFVKKALQEVFERQTVEGVETTTRIEDLGKQLALERSNAEHERAYKEKLIRCLEEGSGCSIRDGASVQFDKVGSMVKEIPMSAMTLESCIQSLQAAIESITGTLARDSEWVILCISFSSIESVAALINDGLSELHPGPVHQLDAVSAGFEVLSRPCVTQHTYERAERNAKSHEHRCLFFCCFGKSKNLYFILFSGCFWSQFFCTGKQNCDCTW